MKDPKKLALMIIAKQKKPEGGDEEAKEPMDSPEEEQSEGDEDYSSQAKDQAADDLFDAIQSKDKDEFKAALADYVKACM